MPMVATIGTREEVFVAAEPTVVSYDLESGKELWRVDCLRYGEVTSVPVYADGLVYVSADSANLSAIDVKTQKIVWESRFYKPGVSTPLLHEGLLYCGADDGAFACYDAKTGEEFWAEFADDGFYASPILADGRVHLLDRSGTMHILKPGRELKILGQSVLGEETSCTPAVIGNSFYIRGVTHLFRIGP
jgi:outer membrane protein assembly factor BamB